MESNVYCMLACVLKKKENEDLFTRIPIEKQEFSPLFASQQGSWVVEKQR